MKTDQATMAAADWDRVERETVEKIRLLKAAVQGMEPGPLAEKVCAELILPAMAILAEFNQCVTVDDSEPNVQVEGSADNATPQHQKGN